MFALGSLNVTRHSFSSRAIVLFVNAVVDRLLSLKEFRYRSISRFVWCFSTARCIVRPIRSRFAVMVLAASEAMASRYSSQTRNVGCWDRQWTRLAAHIFHVLKQTRKYLPLFPVVRFFCTVLFGNCILDFNGNLSLTGRIGKRTESVMWPTSQSS